MQSGSPTPASARRHPIVYAPSRAADLIRWGWRVARTGLGFALFGLGTLFLAMVVLPLIGLLPRSAGSRELHRQRLVHRGVRLFLSIVQRLGVIDVAISGDARLRDPGPHLVIANHPTLIDVLLLIACLPQADCVVKHVHWRNPLMRGLVRAAGYIPNRNGPRLIATCVERLRHGRTLLLFPEGTRSPAGTLGPFRRGAAHIAIESGCAPIPVVIRCEPLAFTKGARWYDVPDRVIRLTVEVEAPLAVHPPAVQQRESALGARRLTASIRAFYERRLAGGSPQHA